MNHTKEILDARKQAAEEFFMDITRIAIFGPTPEMIKEAEGIRQREKILSGIYLKPCRYCGSNKVEISQHHHYSGDPFAYSVRCTNCHASGPSVTQWEKFRETVDAKLEAVRLWNV